MRTYGSQMKTTDLVLKTRNSVNRGFHENLDYHENYGSQMKTTDMASSSTHNPKKLGFS